MTSLKNFTWNSVEWYSSSSSSCQPLSAHCRAKASPCRYHLLLSCVVLIHVMPPHFTISSLHLVFYRLLLREPVVRFHYVAIFSFGKASRPSPFLDFNLFYDILHLSLLSDPFASFFSFLVIPSKHLSTLLCVVLSFSSSFCHCPSLCTICHRW